MRPMNHIARLYWTARAVGWDNLPRRLVQAVRVRSGWLRQKLDPKRFSDSAFSAATSTQAGNQLEVWVQKAGGFFRAPAAADLDRVVGSEPWADSVVAVIDKALAGEYPFFRRWTGRLGWPPDFNLDPVHNLHYPTNVHCSCTARSGPPGDDVKLVWESSRFSLAFHLARAFGRSGDERYAAAFWQMFDAWVVQNPPMLSVAWGCGQESTFRLMAMLFAGMVTRGSVSATQQRLWALSRYAWQAGRLVEANINYARSQKNNHAISEAAALWTIGLVFPEFRESSRWLTKGRQVLTAEARRQIYDDGSYVQHSLNYHRVMMDDLLWAVRLGELHEQRLDEVVYDRLRRAADWLIQMIDPGSGRVPNYGANDGAQVLPLSTCDYLDYRPVAQAANYLLKQQRAFAPGAWDEKMLWLFGPESLAAPIAAPERAAAWSAPTGGYYVLRGRESLAMVRCHTYRDRPGQADMLHVDLWWRGRNVLRDSGSYFYYHADERWKQWFLSTAAHNTIEIDHQDQMLKGPRFMWFCWTRAKVEDFRSDGEAGRFIGRHFGYRRLPGEPVHTRQVVLTSDGATQTWTVRDTVAGAGEHDIVLRWRLIEADWARNGNAWTATLPGGQVQIAVGVPEGFGAELVAGCEKQIEGWESLYYGERQPAATLIVRGRVRLPMELTTIITLAAT